jgi:hypothetical protein
MPLFMRMLLSALVLCASAAPVKLIVDTDMGGGGCRDVDDVAALCLANALHRSREAELLAVVQDTKPAAVAGVISVLNHYYGHDSIPIGAYRGTDLKDDVTLSYVGDLVTHWPSPIKNKSQARDAVDLYREVLSKQACHHHATSSSPRNHDT